MENIYIRARGEPRVSDWVQYSGNKKVRSTGATLHSLASSRALFFFSLFLSPHRFSSRQLVYPCSASFVPEFRKRMDIQERNAAVCRIEMFDHTRDWLILYLLAAFYFS